MQYATLKKKADFDSVFAEKSRVYKNGIGFYFRLVNGKDFRFGLLTPKKLGNAVARNLFRRRIREIIRLFPERISGFELVVSPYRPYEEYGYFILKGAFESTIRWIRENRLKGEN
ncbi:MAG: ribonuclease P protein component [Candidatus Riflebacteria bacterium]|nr:ribonuclease P protein component [Candidatus Riflebacteria bacterium]